MIKKLSIFLIYDGQKLPLTILNLELVSRGGGGGLERGIVSTPIQVDPGEFGNQFFSYNSRTGD